MANRNTENYRTSIQQTAPQETFSPEGQTVDALAGIGQKIIAASQDAKINENFSKAQLDLNAVNEKYKIDNEKDPFGALQDLKENRKNILDSYGSQISPLFRGEWTNTTRQLDTHEDLQMQSWAFQQSKVNTVDSINTSIKNNLSQASSDGQSFGTSDSDDLGSLLNYGQGKQRLMAFGDKHLGGEKTTQMLENYDGDYAKVFMSGVAQTNPLKALRLMDRDDVRAGFKDQNEYLKMKEAINSKALNIDKIQAQQEILGTLKDENSILTQSLEKNVSYSDLQQAMDKNPNMSAEAKNFFLRANGFSNKNGKLDKSEQIQGKAQLYSELSQLVQKPDLSSEEVANFQKRIYSGMNNGTLDDKEGANLLSQVVTPLVSQKEKQFGTFSQDSWVSPDIGFGGVQEIFSKQIEIKPAEGEKKIGPLTEATNNANKVKLYDYYMSSLQESAASYGVQIADIKNLNKPQQRKLYSEAQESALRQFHVDSNPVLSTLPDLPNQVFSKGKLIQGMAGDRSLKPNVTAKKRFDTQIGTDGNLYRLYPDGTRENIGPAPGGIKY